MDQRFQEQLNQEMEKLNILLTERQINQFYQYYEILIEWNQIMNLTAITEMRDVIRKHFVDSLTLIMAVPELKNQRASLVDVGTGAGFPGVPLKIVFPDLQITLMDSLNKRIRFLNTVTEQLALKGIMTVHGRAEDLAHKKEYRESFDYCVSRAVANMATLSEYCIPFVKPGGIFIAYKSGKIEDELKTAEKAIRILGGKTESVVRFSLEEGDRTLIEIKKAGKTDKKYPRKAGTPAKEPIKDMF